MKKWIRKKRSRRRGAEEEEEGGSELNGSRCEKTSRGNER
jgi:hypothetical protein